MYNTLHFDQFSLPAIHLKNFRLSAIGNSKFNSKLEKKKSLVGRARRDESIDV